MAGGVGSRLGAITKHKPKPAIEINGKPFIYYTMDWLRENGFKEFIFLLSYKSEIIEEVILNFDDLREDIEKLMNKDKGVSVDDIEIEYTNREIKIMFSESF